MTRATRSGGVLCAIGDGAAPGAVAAACRGALLAVRDRLTTLQVDVYSDGPWPPDAVEAVQELDELRHARRSRLATRLGREPSISLDLDPRDDHELGLALAIAPYTICGSGFDERWQLLWDVNDTGTSTTFVLLPHELDAVRAHVARSGGRRTDVVVLGGSIG
ncbi:hypothetical protein [Cellulosimicrobium protaetiae]|uniref:Uncharacterized protein n=1 Tax=Cellulosimicrobium protaetiae TaxID=2587808 RepID=A0A6M5UKR0_9MICO|nr:hypothetical protein [Cellulosimicrobium protaetiae]QJW37935.1 hypothetical protein FIC82_018930 [Cellulosimicrobium protaetiae]